MGPVPPRPSDTVQPVVQHCGKCYIYVVGVMMRNMDSYSFLLRKKNLLHLSVELGWNGVCCWCSDIAWKCLPNHHFCDMSHLGYPGGFPAL